MSLCCSDEAEMEYLKITQDLEQYGVNYFQIKVGLMVTWFFILIFLFLFICTVNLNSEWIKMLNCNGFFLILYYYSGDKRTMTMLIW